MPSAASRATPRPRKYISASATIASAFPASALGRNAAALPASSRVISAPSRRCRFTSSAASTSPLLGGDVPPERTAFVARDPIPVPQPLGELVLRVGVAVDRPLPVAEGLRRDRTAREPAVQGAQLAQPIRGVLLAEVDLGMRGSAKSPE